eukprot:TRINITY_DN102861_c0_g5_i2.p1 TRINITY_DN102861_c0_g5~~TRINITY_DN102861_c0_g5_i2.p1  ORF type:complete len:300 (-),score=55.67 TRINITY_DN102861_c0_g5_i2:66-965(-)
MTLTAEDLKVVESAIDGKVVVTAVVRLYKASGSSWQTTDVTGAAAVVIDKKKNSSIKIIDLSTKAVAFSHDLPYEFEYLSPKPFFHTFEVEDAVAGFCFADEGDASNFETNVKSNIPQEKKSSGTLKAAAGKETKAPASPTVAKLQKEEKKATKKKGSFFSGFKKLFTKKKDPAEDFQISTPSGFRHESHIGWDPVRGFEIRNIPPQWKQLFKAAGVKKSELQDGETAKFIMDTVAETLLQQGTPAPPGGAPRPPAPTGAPPAPGGPPPPPSSGPPPPPDAGPSRRKKTLMEKTNGATK